MSKILLTRILLFCAITFSFVGCRTMTHRITPIELRARNSFNIMKLKLGMDRAGVLKIMGKGRIQTYKARFSGSMNAVSKESYEFVENRIIPNPYRLEVFKRNNSLLEILFYYTGLSAGEENIIKDYQLTPLVFENRKLVGWGWGFYNEYVDLIPPNKV